MVLLRDNLCGMDTDELLGYTTKKTVWIRDRWIGLLYYVLIFFVILWVFFGQILWRNEQFLLKDVKGLPRMWASHPTVGGCDPSHPKCKSSYRTFLELSYCDVFPHAGEGWRKAPCRFEDRVTAMKEGEVDNKLFFPTAVEILTEKRVCRPAEENGYSCENEYEEIPGFNCLIGDQMCGNRGDKHGQFYYVADVKNFQLQLTSSYEQGAVHGTSLDHPGYLAMCPPLIRKANVTRRWHARMENAEKNRCTKDEMQITKLPCAPGVDCAQQDKFDIVEHTGVADIPQNARKGAKDAGKSVGLDDEEDDEEKTGKHKDTEGEEEATEGEKEAARKDKEDEQRRRARDNDDDEEKDTRGEKEATEEPIEEVSMLATGAGLPHELRRHHPEGRHQAHGRHHSAQHHALSAPVLGPPVTAWQTFLARTGLRGMMEASSLGSWASSHGSASPAPAPSAASPSSPGEAPAAAPASAPAAQAPAPAEKERPKAKATTRPKDEWTDGVVDGSMPDEYTSPWGDVFKIGRLLELAGANLDQDFNFDGWTTRQSGTVLEVRAVYNNLYPIVSSFGYKQVEYHYEVTELPLPYMSRTELAQSQPADYPETRIYELRHGVLVWFKVSGTFGVFNIAYLLLMLVTGFALFATASGITDFVSLYLHPRKENFFHLKYEVSPDFSDQWKCEKCGYFNWPKDTICQGVPQWTCPKETECCQEPRPRDWRPKNSA